MISVRKMAKSTISLIVFIVVIILITQWSRTLPSGIFYKMEELLSSKDTIGGFYSFILTVSFWCLLISSVFDIVYNEKKGLPILGSFGVTILFSICITIWGLIMTAIYIDFRWFWLIYYFGLIICLILNYRRFTHIDGAGSSNIKIFVKELTKKNETDVNDLDCYIVRTVRALLLLVCIVLIISFIIYCIQYREIFPFVR